MTVEESLIANLEVLFYFTTLSVLLFYLPVLVSIIVLFPLTFKIWCKLTSGTCRSYRRLEGKTIIVSGANSGIGLETAKDLARRGARVILACRNIEKGQAALDEIKRETKSINVFLKHLDLSSLASVRNFVQEIIREESRLDILINNAGTILNHKTLTPDGLETNFQSNYFGPFLLTNLLLGKMRETGNGRIVMVSSNLHKVPRGMDLDNLNSEKTWEPYMVYCRSKLANVLFAAELHRRLRGAGVTDLCVNALSPGGVRTGILRNSSEIWYLRIIVPVELFFFKNAVEGAQTSIHLAVSEEVDGISGEYFKDCQKASTSSVSKDLALAGQLWERSAKAVGLKSDESIVY